MSNDRYLSILNQIKKHGGKIDGGEPNDKILVIDGLNTFIRVFSVIPTLNDDGIHIGGIVGFLKSVGYAIKMLRPTRCIIVFDGKGGSTRRRKVYSEYKNRRKTKIRLNRANEYSSVEDEHQSMLLQLQRGVEYLENLPLTLLSIDNIEADEKACADYIEGSLAMCTSLAPVIGYDKVAHLAYIAYETGKTVREVAMEENVLPEDELNRLLDPRSMTEPNS